MKLCGSVLWIVCEKGGGEMVDLFNAAAWRVAGEKINAQIVSCYIQYLSYIKNCSFGQKAFKSAMDALYGISKRFLTPLVYSHCRDGHRNESARAGKIYL